MQVQFDAESFREALKVELDALSDDDLAAMLREGFSDAVRERAREIAVFLCAERLEKVLAKRGDDLIADAVAGTARAEPSLREAIRSLARRIAREAVDRAFR